MNLFADYVPNTSHLLSIITIGNTKKKVGSYEREKGREDRLVDGECAVHRQAYGAGTIARVLWVGKLCDRCAR